MGIFALAFGIRVAMVDTAALNRRATEASALPTATSCVGGPDGFGTFGHRHMRTEHLQLISAAILSLGGLILLFCGVFIDPQGQIHETLLVAFGETATFAGALFGIDYVYKQKK